MWTSKAWQSKAALMMAMSLGASVFVPVAIAIPANAGTESYRTAQVFRNSTRMRIPAGTDIPVRYEEADKIIVTPDETSDLTLIVDDDILVRGTVVIPEGSKIEGNLRPTDGGTQFVSKHLVLPGRNGSEARKIPINATSQVFTERETITRRSNPNILRGAAIGAAAAAVLSEIFGWIDFLEVLGGAGLGVLAEVLLRRNREVEVIVVDPRDLSLELQDDFSLTRQARRPVTTPRRNTDRSQETDDRTWQNNDRYRLNTGELR